jgi:hypothetical protein
MRRNRARPALPAAFLIAPLLIAGCTYYVDPEESPASGAATQAGAEESAPAESAESGPSGASRVSVALTVDGVTLALSTRTDDEAGWIEALYAVPPARASSDPCGHGEAIFGAEGAVARRVAFPPGVPVPGQTASASERKFDILLDALEELAREPDTTALSMRLCGISGTLAFDAASRIGLRDLVSTLHRLRNEPETDATAARVVRGYAARGVEPAALGYYQAEARFSAPSWAVSVALASPTAGLADRVSIGVELVGNVPRRCNGALNVFIDGRTETLPPAGHDADAQGQRHVYRYATSVENLMAIGAAREVKLSSCYGDTSLDETQRAALGSLVSELARIDGGRS